ncbi:FMN-binding glutamate synthase family protein [Alicyclobacillus sp. SO9]|nr:FMN-binding glutamate synthase family protein [Alicyclobacillus sp. SO9]
MRLKRLMQDKYAENLWEGITALRHVGIQTTFENELRSANSGILYKPLGSSRNFPNFDGLLFSPVQLTDCPLDSSVPVSVRTVLGKHCSRPMVLSMPIMSSAMGYGVALSKSFSLALAKGTGAAGTAFNTGQGPVLPEHRSNSKRMIVQYHGGFWRASDDMLAQADMIEIRFGQGANAGAGTPVPTDRMPEDVFRDFAAMADSTFEQLYIPAGMPDAKDRRELKDLVEHLRGIGRGAPIAIKLAASNNLEQDLEAVVYAGADVVVLDGAQAGTHGSPAILVDDFGLPTLAALCRATRYLEHVPSRKRPDVVVSGGIRTPGDVLKAVTLGATAVYMGSAVLFATTHTQILKPLPFEPPTQIAWAEGGFADDFSIEEGARSLANFLTSYQEELQAGIRALGKTSLSELSESDLVAWDKEAARVTGLTLV